MAAACNLKRLRAHASHFLTFVAILARTSQGRSDHAQRRKLNVANVLLLQLEICIDLKNTASVAVSANAMMHAMLGMYAVGCHIITNFQRSPQANLVAG
jgi:hypothetical protein